MTDTKPLGFNGAMQEGKAAKMFDMPVTANPYQNKIRQLGTMNKEPDSRLCELASDWESGWIRGV